MFRSHATRGIGPRVWLEMAGKAIPFTFRAEFPCFAGLPYGSSGSRGPAHGVSRPLALHARGGGFVQRIGDVLQPVGPPRTGAAAASDPFPGANRRMRWPSTHGGPAIADGLTPTPLGVGPPRTGAGLSIRFFRRRREVGPPRTGGRRPQGRTGPHPGANSARAEERPRGSPSRRSRCGEFRPRGGTPGWSRDARRQAARTPPGRRSAGTGGGGPSAAYPPSPRGGFRIRPPELKLGWPACSVRGGAADHRRRADTRVIRSLHAGVRVMTASDETVSKSPRRAEEFQSHQPESKSPRTQVPRTGEFRCPPGGGGPCVRATARASGLRPVPRTPPAPRSPAGGCGNRALHTVVPIGRPARRAAGPTTPGGGERDRGARFGTESAAPGSGGPSRPRS